jgi:hypothetical protein
MENQYQCHTGGFFMRCNLSKDTDRTTMKEYDMRKILFFGFLFILFFSTSNIFALDWFDMSTPNMDRKACLVSNDYGRDGYRAAVNLIKRLSGNKAEDVSQYMMNQISAEQITNLAVQLFQKTGKTGTYVMVADITSGNILMRCYYIVCAGLVNTYLYVYAYVL